MYNLLNAATEGVRFIGIGEAALYALIGFAVVFAGIAFLVLIVWLVGLVMERIPQMIQRKKAPDVAQPVMQEEEEIEEETVAVITAAIAAYYQQAQVPCDFVVKKIKRSRV